MKEKRRNYGSKGSSYTENYNCLRKMVVHLWLKSDEVNRLKEAVRVGTHKVLIKQTELSYVLRKLSILLKLKKATNFSTIKQVVKTKAVKR